jgi:hypothetical protein
MFPSVIRSQRGEDEFSGRGYVGRGPGGRGCVLVLHLLPGPDGGEAVESASWQMTGG